MKPPDFENERNSIAHSRAPGISKIERGSDGSRTYASYAASKRMIALCFRAQSTHAASRGRSIVEPVGLFGKQR